MDAEWFTANQQNWDCRAEAHTSSGNYGIETLLADPEALSPVVAADKPYLGDLTGLRGVHLQCHIGTDTLSLARLGAAMTGVDLSPHSIAEAGRIAEAAGCAIDYQVANVYDAVAAVSGRTFDLVYTGVGALTWLPDLTRWAEVVAELLVPGGRLVLTEIHPLIVTLADTRSSADPLALTYPYFHQAEPMRWESSETYVPTEQALTSTVTYEWSHSLGDIVTALLASGLTLTGLTERNAVPYNALPGHLVAGEDGFFRLAENPDRLPGSFTITATKPHIPSATQ